MKQTELLISISKLTPFQKGRLEMYIIDALKLNESDENVKPSLCPYCKQETDMIKKGFKRGKQRYQCKGCKHVFTYNSHNITMYSKIERSMFQKIILDTLNCIPLKQTAAELDLSITSVFENRHKVLCALEEILNQEDVQLSGTIEFDETYELESQKGTKQTNRKARKRGGPSKFRGISHEQVCIVTTTDRNGHEIFKAVGFGKPTTHSIQDNFGGKLVKKSIVYTDGVTTYDQLIKDSDCTTVQLKTYVSYNQVEHLNTLNCIHSLMKRQLSAFRGVATKYMSRYMSLFVFIRRFQSMDDNEKLPILLSKMNNLHLRKSRLTLKTFNLFSRC